MSKKLTIAACDRIAKQLFLLQKRVDHLAASVAPYLDFDVVDTGTLAVNESKEHFDLWAEVQALQGSVGYLNERLYTDL